MSDPDRPGPRRPRRPRARRPTSRQGEERDASSRRPAVPPSAPVAPSSSPDTAGPPPGPPEGVRSRRPQRRRTWRPGERPARTADASPGDEVTPPSPEATTFHRPSELRRAAEGPSPAPDTPPPPRSALSGASGGASRTTTERGPWAVASRGLGWEAPAGAIRPPLQVQWLRDDAAVAAPVATPEPVAAVAPTEVGPTARDTRVVSSRQTALLVASALLFLSMVVLTGGLWWATRPASPPEAPPARPEGPDPAAIVAPGGRGPGPATLPEDGGGDGVAPSEARAAEEPEGPIEEVPPDPVPSGETRADPHAAEVPQPAPPSPTPDRPSEPADVPAPSSASRPAGGARPAPAPPPPDPAPSPSASEPPPEPEPAAEPAPSPPPAPAPSGATVVLEFPTRGGTASITVKCPGRATRTFQVGRGTTRIPGWEDACRARAQCDIGGPNKPLDLSARSRPHVCGGCTSTDRRLDCN